MLPVVSASGVVVTSSTIVLSPGSLLLSLSLSLSGFRLNGRASDGNRLNVDDEDNEVAGEEVEALVLCLPKGSQFGSVKIEDDRSTSANRRNDDLPLESIMIDYLWRVDADTMRGRHDASHSILLSLSSSLA